MDTWHHSETIEQALIAACAGDVAALAFLQICAPDLLDSIAQSPLVGGEKLNAQLSRYSEGVHRQLFQELENDTAFFSSDGELEGELDHYQQWCAQFE